MLILIDIRLQGHATHHHARLDKFSTKEGMNLAALGVLVHILGDALNTVGVIIVGLITWFVKNPNKKYADPALSIAIAVSILLSSLPLAYNSATILLQAAPRNMPQEYILEDLMMLPNVEQVHDLHIWQIDQKKTVASAHVIVGKSSSSTYPKESIAQEDFRDSVALTEVRNCLHAWGIHSVTLQLEHCPQSEEPQAQPEQQKLDHEDTESMSHRPENPLTNKILRKRNHNSATHTGISCLADQAINCDCTLDYQQRCCPKP